MSNIPGIIERIINETTKLNNTYLPEESFKINYSAIFCKDAAEYDLLNTEALSLGKVVEDTQTGTVYKLEIPIETSAGPLWLIKIRKPDTTRPERGDADFTVSDYPSFKAKYLNNSHNFKVIDRGIYEMLELRDTNFNAISYFSSIPLTAELGIV